MSPSKAHMFRLGLIALCAVGLGVAIWGALWGLLALFLAMGGYLIFEEVRRIADPSLDEEAAKISPLDRLGQELDNPRPVNMAIGNLLVLAVVLAVLIDGDISVWMLVPAIVFQLIWIAAMVIRRRKKVEPPPGTDAPSG